MKNLALLLALLCPLLVFGQDLEAGTFVVRKASTNESLDALVTANNDTAFRPNKRERQASLKNPNEVENRLKAGLYVSNHVFKDSVKKRFRKSELKTHREFIFIGGKGQAIYFSSALSVQRVKRIMRKRKFRTGMVDGNWEYSSDNENNRVEFDLRDERFNGSLIFTGIYKRKRFTAECYSEKNGLPEVDDQSYRWVSVKKKFWP